MMEEDEGRVHKKTNSPWRMDMKADGYKVDNGEVTWHPHGLSSPNQQNRYMERIPQNMYLYEDLPFKEKFLFPKKEKSRFYTTIKTQ